MNKLSLATSTYINTNVGTVIQPPTARVRIGDNKILIISRAIGVRQPSHDKADAARGRHADLEAREGRGQVGDEGCALEGVGVGQIDADAAVGLGVCGVDVQDAVGRGRAEEGELLDLGAQEPGGDGARGQVDVVVEDGGADEGA